jgi:hypothetical protein
MHMCIFNTSFMSEGVPNEGFLWHILIKLDPAFSTVFMGF